MKALIYDTQGTDVLEYREVTDPLPGAADVVVRVAATTVNHLDAIQRNGWFTMPGFSLPHISGMDVVGTVMELGSDVTRVSIGDRVVVDPSLTSVPEKSFLSGRGDLYLSLIHI